jgi:hypothetical protein
MSASNYTQVSHCYHSVLCFIHIRTNCQTHALCVHFTISVFGIHESFQVQVCLPEKVLHFLHEHMRS